MHRRLITFSALALLGLAISSCNIFDPIDSPSGDAQILSAARAAFDKGDYEKARELYAKLSSKDDKIRSEEAFRKLTAAGVDASFFVSAFGGGGGAAGLNQMASQLSHTAGEALRLAIYDAVLDVTEISDPNLRGLVRLISTTALAAELMAETAGDTGEPHVLEPADVAGASCNTATCAGCTGGLGGGATQNLSGSTDGDFSGFDFSGTADLGMFNGAVLGIQEALSANELGAGGSFSSGTGGFASQVIAVDPATFPECYRAGLLDAGLGE